YMRFDRSAMTDMTRNVIGTLNNSVRFFKTYSQLDKWEAPKTQDAPSSSNLLDQWILARTNQTIGLATKSADNYKIAHAILPVFDLINDMSNWYIRRSRKRFWKSENDKDKQQAYATLHYTLVTICQLMAPWAPFISDRLWRELTEGLKVAASVHLSDWPSVSKPDKASTELLDEMTILRKLVTGGLEIRAREGIKVRQPLGGATLGWSKKIKNELLSIAQDELNVKTIQFNLLEREGSSEIKLATKITPELKAEGISRELTRQIQNARKNAGLNVEDRIKLKIESDSTEITGAIDKFKPTIFRETLATGELSGAGDYSETVKVEGQEVKISLSKA
ncbi:MAG: class I tRNA ligase family protein, partial [Patescibacteria group bacterium]